MKQDYATIVNQVYDMLHNHTADFKFTPPAITMLQGNIAENDMLIEDQNGWRYQTSSELIDTILNNDITTEITHFYIQQCNEKLGTYDPREIRKNLKDLNLL